MSNKRTKSIFLTLIIFFLIIIVSSWYVLTQDKDIIVKIPAKANAEEIASLLKENRVIISRQLFIWLVHLSGSSTKLHSGTYRLNHRTTVFDVLYKLRKGKVILIKITIPEGFRSEQISQLLQQKNIADAARFMEYVAKNKLEGFLFPETYFFSVDTGEEIVARKLNNEFEKRYTPEFEEQSKKLKMTKQMVVTLASIIEKEAKLESEKPLISGVFHNRLKKRWYLESCATVRYASNKYHDKLLYKDLKIKSPYNTYRTFGLPPGPICNPGLSSIKAALYPAQTDLLFFFSKDDQEGRHEFSRYYKEHIQGQKKRKG